MCINCIEGSGPHIAGGLTRREILARMGAGSAMLAAAPFFSSAAFAQEATGTTVSGTPTVAYALKAVGQPFERYAFERRALNPDDILIDIEYCGICHTDVHIGEGQFGPPPTPLVPGHELTGRVSAVGSSVTKFKVGDAAGVGCMVDSCGVCEFCVAGLEQYCAEGNTQTYGMSPQGVLNFGGYSNKMVVKESFGIKIPESMDLATAAPLLCAGITTFSPMQHWAFGAEQKVGIVGLGGLGHIAVKLAVARGSEVTVFTTTEAKREDALAMGAADVVVWPDQEAVAARASQFDRILSTVPYAFDVNPFVSLLKLDGTMVNVGLFGAYGEPVATTPMIVGRRQLAGSLIGGIAETQQVIDYCAEQNIAADIELIGVKDIQAAYQRVLSKDVRYRFVIDLRELA
jgi:uncharacterized zinc-type alcohol dehydrogenase-like protein